MPLTAQFQWSLDYHTLSVIPRNETQRKCSIFVNIGCVFSRLYCALIFACLYNKYIYFGCWYDMEVKNICYVVQYAVHTELCSTNLFFSWIFLLFIGTFFNKTLLTMSSGVWFTHVFLMRNISSITPGFVGHRQCLRKRFHTRLVSVTPEVVSSVCPPTFDAKQTRWLSGGLFSQTAEANPTGMCIKSHMHFR